jgi:hypothetical protein
LIVVEVDELALEKLMLTFTLLLAAVGSKLVPVMVTAVPTVPTVGVKLVIVGASVEPITIKAAALVAEPAGVVTPIGPVLAADGTLVMIWVGVAEVTVAGVPLKLTVFWPGVGENPIPYIVTVVPTGPLLGVKSMIETCVEACREIPVRLPTES